MTMRVWNFFILYITVLLINANGYSQDKFLLSLAEHLHLKNSEFSIPIKLNESVENWIKAYSGENRAYLVKKLEKFARDSGAIKEIFADYAIPEDLAYLYLLSSERYLTWDILYSDKLFSLKNDWYRDERKNLLKATMVTAEYLANQYKESKDWDLVITEYFKLASKLSSQTPHSVEELYALLIIAKNLETFGFSDLKYNKPLNFREILLSPLTDLELLAEKLDVPLKKIKKLNPELKSWFIPANLTQYYLRIPPESLKKFEKCCKNPDKNDSFVHITINRTQNFKTIAAMFKVPIYVLSEINHIPPQTILTEGMIIKLPFKRKDDNSIANLYAMLTKVTAPLPKKTVPKTLAKKIVKSYKVRRGDNLTIIARRHNSSVHKILVDNKNLNLKSKLFPGFIIYFK